jgi:hypothetical protein
MINQLKLCITFSLLLLFQAYTSAQENVVQNDNHFKHSLGVAGGFTTGYGLSYRYVPQKLGIQATTLLVKDDYQTNFNLGVTFLYKLIDADKTNFFLYQGNMLYYHKSEPDPYNYYIDDSSDNYFNNSIGIGIEFIILKRVSLNIMGGYAAYENFDRIGFTGETGLYFMF